MSQDQQQSNYNSPKVEVSNNSNRRIPIWEIIIIIVMMFFIPLLPFTILIAYLMLRNKINYRSAQILWKVILTIETLILLSTVFIFAYSLITDCGGDSCGFGIFIVIPIIFLLFIIDVIILALRPKLRENNTI